jgi:hypothetical protein
METTELDVGHTNGRIKHMKPAGYKINKDISLGSLQRFGMGEASTMAFSGFY